jgi:competence protein ComEC
MLLPLFIVYFHRVSLSSVILNIGVSLAMALLSLVAVLALIVGQFSLALAGPLVGISNGINWLMTHSVDPFMRLGISSLRVPEYSGWAASVYVLYYVPFIVLAMRLSRWRPLSEVFATSRRGRNFAKATVLVQILALVVIVFHPFSERRVNGRLEVNFLDVGQGDAALVTMPDGMTLLIDGGGRPNFLSQKRVSKLRHEEVFERDTRSIGEAVVSEYLWWRGLDHVDYVLATHMDADHVDGLNDVLRSFAVRSVLVGRTPRADPEFRKFYETAWAEGVPINLIGAGDVLRIGDASARVLWPMASKNLPSRNNDSIVLRLEFGKHKILLTGDIERASEAALLATKTKNYLSADVVKAPHHGSKSSSTAAFVKPTGAKFTIISVGQTSIFGHPHREVVERWQSSGAKVLTTGKSGMISVTTNGNDLTLETFVRDQD